MIDHVGRMRCIGLWWMLDHESMRCNMAAAAPIADGSR
jgi:hypothetical protein